MGVARVSSLIDVLRTSYVGLPRPMKLAITPALFLLPVSFRFGRRYRAMCADVSRSHHDPSFVRDAQRRNLRDLAIKAFNGSPFYRERMTRIFGADFDPATLDIAALARLPVLTKAEVSAHAEDMLTVPANRMAVRATSGSAHSTRLRVYLDPDRSVREMAFVHSFANELGWRLGDRRVRLDGNLFNKGRAAEVEAAVDPALRELWLSPFRLSEDMARAHLARIRDYDPVLLYGVPSALSVLARCAERDSWTPGRSLRAVLTTSETLFPHQRELLVRAFSGVKVRSYYGLTERSAIAGELPDAPEVFEFEPLYGLTELVDDDGRALAEPGATGRVVSTGFVSTGMPLIRYEGGDRAVLVEAPSEANCYRLRVTKLRSRWSQEYLVGSGQELVSVVNYLQDVDDGILHDYQFVQDTPGHATLLAVLAPEVRPEQLDSLVAFHNRLTGAALVLESRIVNEIPRGFTAKAKLVDQRLALPALAGSDAAASAEEALQSEANSAG